MSRFKREPRRQRSGKDLVQRAMAALNLQRAEEVFTAAAQWLRDNFGRRIKRGARKEAIARYNHGRTIADWVQMFCRGVTRRRQYA